MPGADRFCAFRIFKPYILNPERLRRSQMFMYEEFVPRQMARHDPTPLATERHCARQMRRHTRQRPDGIPTGQSPNSKPPLLGPQLARLNTVAPRAPWSRRKRSPRPQTAFSNVMSGVAHINGISVVARAFQNSLPR